MSSRNFYLGITAALLIWPCESYGQTLSVNAQGNSSQGFGVPSDGMLYSTGKDAYKKADSGVNFHQQQSIGWSNSFYTADTTARYGHLSGFSEAVDTQANSNAYTSAGFTDILTVTSGSLPKGAPVTISIYTIFESETLTASTSNVDGSDGGEIDMTSGATDVDPNGPGVRDVSYTLSLPPNGSFQEFADYLPDMTTNVGDKIQVYSDLQTYAEAWSWSTYLPYAAAADSDHSSYLYADSLTPGVYLVSASGHDYSKPAVTGTPEPASMGEIGIGMLGLGVLLFNARKRDQNPV